MKDKLSAFWSGFKDKWSSLAKNLRIFIITAVSVVIVAAIVLAIVLNQKGYTAIYTGLDSEESSQVVSAINELGITDVKMGTDGSISVPSDQADNVRMQLSIQGYPKSTFNFDVWNSGIGIWSTDTEKKVLQIQQLQTHLMKAINTISAVKNSYVIITMPENSNYVISTDSEEPRVSVKLDLKNGAQLTSDQVEGIYALVLNSLPGLERENISILDSGGKLLSGENTTVEEDVLYQSRLNFQEQMQSLLKSQLNDTLKKLYKDYTINVNVKLNYDNSKSEYTIYTPSVAEDGTSGGMIESSTKNEGWGGIGSLSGVVGTTSNSDISPNYPTITGDGDNQYYYQNSITVKRLVNTEIRQLEKNGYSVDKITAAVTVDQVNMLEADKEQLREVIAFAIGADVANVTVANYPFVINGNNGTNGGGNTINRGGSVDWTVYIILLLGLLVLALLIVAILTSNAKKKKRAKARAKAAAAQAAAAQAAQDYAAQAKAQAEAIFEKSRSDGFAKGHEDGYAAGLDKCRDMLSEIKRLSEQMVSDKAELFDSYEVEIFDTVMEIVNRITLNSLGQKDKAVIKKTIKEAGKSFRGSEYVKLTLSKTDVSEEMAADTDYFKKLFTNVKNVEVEVLKDAPSGTVIIDNGSEITDAGIQTQLKMIEELGRGKYRRAPSRKKADKQEETAAKAETDNDGGEEQSE